MAAGVALTLRPFTSLAVLVVFVAVSFIATGVSELASMEAPAIAVVLVGLGRDPVGCSRAGFCPARSERRRSRCCSPSAGRRGVCGKARGRAIPC